MSILSPSLVKNNIFFLIFKFILIYLLHVLLFVLKIDDIFGKRKSQSKSVENGRFLYIYIVYIIIDIIIIENNLKKLILTFLLLL